MKKSFIKSAIVVSIILMLNAVPSYAIDEGTAHTFSIPKLETFEFKPVAISKIQYPSFNYTEKTYPNINKGESGEHVRELQEKLNALGYSTNGIDGNFGDGTKAALIKFQSNNGLEVTGVADAATQKKLQELISRSGNSTSSPSKGYTDGMKSDGKIHVYLVGKGEMVNGKNSTSIKSMTYYQESDHLTINFNGKEYVFANVDSSLWGRLKGASSSEEFYNTNIKGNKYYWVTDYNGQNGGLIVTEYVNSSKQQSSSAYSYKSNNSYNTQASQYSHEPEFTTCVVCERIYNKDDMYEYAGDYICENCLDGGDYSTCAGCGIVHHIDYMYNVGDELYCESCAEERYEEYYEEYDEDYFEEYGDW